MKTIDIQAKEWFDRINGNSYFSMQIIIDFGLETEETIFVPMQYGYGDQYLYTAKDKLIKMRKLVLSLDLKHTPLTYICRERKIILRYSKQDNCLKKDVVNFAG